MSYVDDLVSAYRTFVALPWPDNLAPAQRVWMAVYPPEYERRLRLHVPDFEVATKETGHTWSLLDITTSFEEWMADHEYRDETSSHPTCSSRRCRPFSSTWSSGFPRLYPSSKTMGASWAYWEPARFSASAMRSRFRPC